MSNYTNTGILALIFFFCFAYITASAYDVAGFNIEDPYMIVAAATVDTIPLEERYGDFINDPQHNPFDLRDPDVIKKDVEYDPVTNQYILTERIGEDYFRAPTYMTFDEYIKWKKEEQERAYFAQLAGLSGGANYSKRDDPMDRIDVSRTMIDRLFGGSTVDIRPQGTIDIMFGVDYQKIDDNSLPERARSSGGFDFDMAIQMSLAGKIGEKLSMDVNYNTESTFDFDRVLKLQYNTDAFTEDEIIKKIEAGNVSLPLRNSLIQGSQNLFGLKTELQFGRLRLTGVASQQKSEQQQLRLEGGAQEQEFEIRADRYDENRNFFLSHYNRDNFERSLDRLPQINSQFRVTKIEVWVTNTQNEIENNRDIVLLSDLGEFDKLTTQVPERIKKPSITNPDLTRQFELPSNESNYLYRQVVNTRNISQVRSFLTGSLGLAQARDFEKVSARLLSPSEYNFHPELGFVSLNIGVSPSQVVGVSYEYTYNGETYQVGEFSQEVPLDPDEPTVLYVKMLKSTTPRVDLPIWDLMMKNIYGIGAFQVTDEDFNLDFFYETTDSINGDVRNIPGTSGDVANSNLIELLNLDNLNSQRDPQPDGRFDFISGLTINTRNGRIMIPKLEPFGSSLAALMTPEDAALYTYPQLYDSTVTAAREFPEFNRFLIKGSHKSSTGREISLGAFNVNPSSVRVTAAGKTLIEGVDYDINASQGTVTLLRDDLIASGIPVNVNYEDQALFSFQTKTMLGLRADYEFSENFNIGGTYLNLSERPFTQKVNVGDDPINNTVYGLDLNYTTESQFLTRMVDKIPLINTKEKSNVNVSAEFAALRPGHAGAIDSDTDEGGSVYVDDFDAAVSESPLSNGSPSRTWSLASVPTDNGDDDLPRFTEAVLTNDLATGINRAGLSWYNAFQNTLTAADRDDPYCRTLFEREIFPDRAINTTQQNTLFTLNLNYRPDERGPYNYDTPGASTHSAGATFDGREVVLEEPETRWAGIQREIPNPNFETTNIEYLEFWLLNPYIGKPGAETGKLIIQMGNISEDVVKDSRYFYEHGIPGIDDDRNIDTTVYGRIPSRSPLPNASFDNDDASRPLQDVGFDGMDDGDEASFFQDYLNSWDDGVRSRLIGDPSNDNFVALDDPSFSDATSCTERYEKFNAPQGNNPINNGSAQIGRSEPDEEDIDNNGSIDESESYYSYEISLSNDNGEIDVNLSDGRITDTRVVPGFSTNGDNGKWYRYRIPLREPDQVVGGIRDFRSIRFIRMYMTEFAEPVVLRFAELQLNRSQWREYRRFNNEMCEADPPTLEQDAVGIVENMGRQPFNYVLPPGIQREQTTSTFQNGLENEESLSLEVCGLNDGCDEAGVYKLVNFDFRLYDRLKMFLHAEASEVATENLDSSDVEVFLRFGSDLENNYYEYVKPLTFSQHLMDDAQRNSPTNVWREENNIDIDLKEVVKFKRGVGSIYDDLNNLSVVGFPNLADAKSMLIGVRAKDGEDFPSDCIEVWANEMRVSGLDEQGGIAALVRMDAQLADFGNVAASYNYSSIGYGGLDQPLVLRQREDVQGYDLSSNLELGKFLPKKSGIKIPFYIQRSVATSTPEYDPYDEDVKLTQKLADVDNDAEVKDRAIDYSSITSVNFTNVRKERTGDATPKPWDIENISLSYSNTKEVQHDPIIESDVVNTRRIGLTYNYARKGKFIQPFKKIIKNKTFLGWIKEFNFNPLPNSVGFDTELDRRFGEVKYRAIQNRAYFNKYYNWDRNYNLNWDFTKSLKLSFNATNRGVIDEPDENELLREYSDPNERNGIRNDAIWESLREFGRNKNYSHNLDLSYNLPFKHLPYLDWVNVRAQYSATYNWDAASLNVESLGNSLQNSQRRQLNADFDIKRFYKKIGYFKRIESKPRKSKGKKSRTSKSDDAKDLSDAQKKRAKRDSKKTGKLDTDSKKDDVSNNSKVASPGKTVIPSTDPNNPDPAVALDPKASAAPDDKKEKKKGPRQISGVERALVRTLLSVRQVRFTYTRDFRSFVPGYLPQTEYLGLGETLSAPGWGYITGAQPNNAWLENAAYNELWISEDEELNQQFLLGDRENYDLKFSLEPFKDFKLDINWSKSKENTHTSNFKKFDETYWDFRNPRDVGSYTISYYMANTLFGSDINELFNEFSDNRAVLSERLANESSVNLGSHQIDTLDNGTSIYREGYGRLHSEVVIPSFIAAYTGQNANTVGLNLFKLTPKPNWNLRWNGLSKVGFIKDYFSNVSITHGYSSTLTVNSYNTNNDFEGGADLFAEVNKSLITQDFYSRLDVPDLVIREQFTPLLGVNVTTKKGATINFDYKKARQLTLSLRESGEVRETKSTDYTFGFGQTFKNVNIGFLQINPGQKSRNRKKKSTKKRSDKKPKVDPDDDKKTKKTRRRGKDKPKGSDLNLRVDISFRDDVTVTHELDVEGDAIPTRGSKTLRIAPSVDYDINDNLNIRFFFDYNSTKSVVNPPYPILNTAGGVNLRFKLN